MKTWRHSLLVALFTSLVNSSVGFFFSFFASLLLFSPDSGSHKLKLVHVYTTIPNQHLQGSMPSAHTLQTPFLVYTFPAYRSSIHYLERRYHQH